MTFNYRLLTLGSYLGSFLCQEKKNVIRNKRLKRDEESRKMVESLVSCKRDMCKCKVCL